MITLEDIRKNIVEAIQQSGFKQSDIAEYLNIKQQSVSQYISGRALPSLDTLANLCVMLDVSADSLLGIK